MRCRDGAPRPSPPTCRSSTFLNGIDHALRNRVIVELNVRLGAAHLSLGETRKGHALLDVAIEAFDRRVRLGSDEPFTQVLRRRRARAQGRRRHRDRVPGARGHCAAGVHARAGPHRAGIRRAAKRRAAAAAAARNAAHSLTRFPIGCRPRLPAFASLRRGSP